MLFPQTFWDKLACFISQWWISNRLLANLSEVFILIRISKGDFAFRQTASLKSLMIIYKERSPINNANSCQPRWVKYLSYFFFCNVIEILYIALARANRSIGILFILASLQSAMTDKHNSKCNLLIIKFNFNQGSMSRFSQKLGIKSSLGVI